MSTYHLVGEEDQWKIRSKARSVLDSEYDSIKDFGPDDLWDYLSSLFPGIERHTSDELYDELNYLED